MKKLIVISLCLLLNGSAWSAYALKDHRGDALGFSGGTTGTINSTGADLLIVAVGYYNGITNIIASDVTDNKSNTYTPLTQQGASNGEGANRIFYCQGCNVGTGHTVTISPAGSNVYLAVTFAAFSGSAVTPFDQENGVGFDSAGTTSIQPGSITPTQNNELVLSSLSTINNSAGSITNNTDAILDQVDTVGGVNYGCALAYTIQTTATSENPLWAGFTYRGGTVIASFKAAASGGGGALPGSFRGLNINGGKMKMSSGKITIQ